MGCAERDERDEEMIRANRKGLRWYWWGLLIIVVVILWKVLGLP